MTHEYGDPFNDDTIASAVAMTLALRGERPDLSLEEAVERAVHDCICSCAVDIEDGIEHRRSGMHAELAGEVMHRARRRMIHSLKDKEVDEASKESFPASDPPSWIWERPLS